LVVLATWRNAKGFTVDLRSAAQHALHRLNPNHRNQA
jgi:hypothetical protein